MPQKPDELKLVLGLISKKPRWCSRHCQLPVLARNLLLLQKALPAGHPCCAASTDTRTLKW
jgi:hypothetical protein